MKPMSRESRSNFYSPIDIEVARLEAARTDPSAFSELYHRYVTPVYRYLLRRVGNQAEAEDLTAQVFIEVLEGLVAYREKGNFTAWLFTIARRRAIDHYRKKQELVELDDNLIASSESNDPVEIVSKREEIRHLEALITNLDEEKQELLRLRYAGGLTYAEIGNLQGRSEAAVKMAVQRTLHSLKLSWEVSDGYQA